MVDRHVVTKQRSPSIKEVIARIEAMLVVETTEKGRAQLEKYLKYWERRKEESHARTRY